MCRNFIASFLWLLYKIISSIIFIGFSLLEFAYNKFSKTTIFEKNKKWRKENDGWRKRYNAYKDRKEGHVFRLCYPKGRVIGDDSV